MKHSLPGCVEYTLKSVSEWEYLCLQNLWITNVSLQVILHPAQYFEILLNNQNHGDDLLGITDIPQPLVPSL